jgi:hypothetical protein
MTRIRSPSALSKMPTLLKPLFASWLLFVPACTDSPNGAEEQRDAERDDARDDASEDASVRSADARARSSDGSAERADRSPRAGDASHDSAARPPTDGGGALTTGGDASSDARTATAADARTSTPMDAQGCAAALLCADFEQGTPPALPSPWSASAPDCSGDGKVSLDESSAHGGKRALRVSSGGGYCNHAFAAPKVDLTSLSDELWVRLYVRFDKAPGNEHVTFLSMHDQISGKSLRMGFQMGIFMWNRERDDATLPELSPSGIELSVAPKAATWQCIEFRLSGARGELETFVDGTRIEALQVDGTPTQDVDGQWLRPGAWTAKVDDLRVGWESYGSQPMTLSIDDVVVAENRPGC